MLQQQQQQEILKSLAHQWSERPSSPCALRNRVFCSGINFSPARLCCNNNTGKSEVGSRLWSERTLCPCALRICDFCSDINFSPPASLCCSSSNNKRKFWSCKHTLWIVNERTSSPCVLRIPQFCTGIHFSCHCYNSKQQQQQQRNSQALTSLWSERRLSCPRSHALWRIRDPHRHHFLPPPL